MSRSKKAKPESESSSAQGPEKLRDLEVKDASEVQGGKAKPRDFNFTHVYDKSSPTLG